MRTIVGYSIVAAIGAVLMGFIIYVESVGFENFSKNGFAATNSAPTINCNRCHMQHHLASAANRFNRYYPGFHLECDWDLSNVQGPCRVYRYKDKTFAGKAEFALLKVFALTDGAVLVTTINEDPLATLL